MPPVTTAFAATAAVARRENMAPGRYAGSNRSTQGMTSANQAACSSRKAGVNGADCMTLQSRSAPATARVAARTSPTRSRMR